MSSVFIVEPDEHEASLYPKPIQTLCKPINSKFLLADFTYSSDSRVESIDHADTESASDHAIGSVPAGFQDVNGNGRAGSNFLERESEHRNEYEWKKIMTSGVKSY